MKPFSEVYFSLDLSKLSANDVSILWPNNLKPIEFPHVNLTFPRFWNFVFIQSLKVATNISLHKQYSSTRQNRDFNISIASVNTVYHDSESISYKSPKIWEMAPIKRKKPVL